MFNPRNSSLYALPSASLFIRLQHHDTTNKGGDTGQETVLAVHNAGSVGAGGLAGAGTSLSSG